MPIKNMILLYFIIFIILFITGCILKNITILEITFFYSLIGAIILNKKCEDKKYE